MFVCSCVVRVFCLGLQHTYITIDVRVCNDVMYAGACVAKVIYT